jgi:polar amino acid transport system substrate-binding protein
VSVLRQAALALLAVLVGLTSVASTLASPSRTAVPAASCAKADLELVSDGKLTIGTDNPTYGPWFGGGELKGSKWKGNDPSTGKGFESAVAYAVAKQLGFKPSEVEWTYVPFNKSFAPGKKSFDFDVNQISFTPDRAKVVSFSNSYYNVNQALVALKGTQIAKARTIRALRDYKLGAQLGTTSYSYIEKRIRPSKKPAVFDDNAAAIQQLKNGQIDGIVVDLPTAFYVTAVQVPDGTIVGQFPSPVGGEHFGMVFAKGNPLVACVNLALAKLTRAGTLQKLQQQWLAKATGAPVLK